MYAIVSSAKSLAVELMFSGMSLIKKRKRLGPSTDPCGTPDSTSMESDVCPSIITHWVLSQRKLLIQLFVFPVIP